MRRERFFRMDVGEALALLTAAPTVHLAASNADGTPILRTLHGVVVDGALCFHAAPVGEKSEGFIGRPVVVACEEVVAAIPSYFIDAEAACPATTLYRSVQAHGVLGSVDEPAAKARVLQALMSKYQPEAGHVPIEAGHERYEALYRKQVDALWIGRVALDRVDGKSKLAQNRSPAERVRLCEQLWRRGADGDVRAIEFIRDANRDMSTPSFLQFEPMFENSNGGSNENLARMVTLHCQLDERDLARAVELLAPEYWNVGRHGPEDIAGAIRGSTAWVGARDGDGRLIASARGLADGHKFAWIYDVVVAPEWRGAGLGQALLRLILDHPRLRHAHSVFLRTRDAQKLYAKFGFVDVLELRMPFPATTMLLVRR